MLLMHAGCVTQGCYWAFGRDSVFLHPANSRCVVAAGEDGGTPDVMLVCLNGELAKDAGMLKVAVC